MKIVRNVLVCLIVVAFFMISYFFALYLFCYKTDYAVQVETASKEFDVDKAMIFSIIKAESRFNKNAKSNAGAIGLMQIKLSTANYICDIKGEQNVSEDELFVPSTNIRLGVAYYKYLLNKFANVETTICAYNAGETTVRAWLMDKTYSKNGKTLSVIPYEETKNYLEKVTKNFSVYSKLLKNS